SDSTTKSTARPSAGRASDGPTMDTSVPPARIRRADRFPMSPPMTSNTRSTPPTSSKASLSRSTNSLAPKSSAFARSAARPVPVRGGAPLTGGLAPHSPAGARRAVREDALSSPKAAVVEQPLPRSQPRDRQARAHGEVDGARQRREVACLDGHVLRQGAISIP